MAVRHAGHQGAQTQRAGAAGNKPERRIALEHRILGRCDSLHLEEVVHDRERAYANPFGTLSEVGDTVADAGRTASPVEPPQVEVEMHATVLARPTNLIARQARKSEMATTAAHRVLAGGRVTLRVATRHSVGRTRPVA